MDKSALHVAGGFLLFLLLTLSSTSANDTDVVVIAESTPMTIALLPPHNRADARHAPIGDAIAAIVGSVIDQSGKAVMVNRDRVQVVVDEKAMARAELSDAHALGQPGRMIGADVLLFPVYDIVGDELSIYVEIVSTDRRNLHNSRSQRDYARVTARGPVRDTAAVIARLAGELKQSLLADAIEYDFTAIPLVPDAGIGLLDIVNATQDAEHPAQAWLLSEHLDLHLVALPFKRVERQRIAVVLKERQLALSGMTLRGQALGIGHMVGASYMLVGVYTGWDRDVRLDLHVLDVATGIIVASVSHVDSFESLIDRLPEMVAQLGAALPGGIGRARHLEAHKPTNSEEAPFIIQRAYDMMPRTRWSDRIPDDLYDNMRPWIALALDLGPKVGYVHYLVASINYHRGGDEATTVAELQHAVELSPDDWYCQMGLANFFEHRERYAEALPVYRRARDIAVSGQTVSSDRGIAHALLRLGRPQEAIDVLRETVKHPIKMPQVFHIMAESLEALDELAEAAAFREAHARWVQTGVSWRTARDAYLRAGNAEAARLMIELSCQFSLRSTEQEDMWWYVEQVAEVRPSRAAIFCYWFIANAEEEQYRDKARQLLERMGMPPYQPAMTGPVFDIDALRAQGIRAVLQVYDGFRHPQMLPFLQAQIEDVLGIPIVIDLKSRPLPLRDYQRNRDLLDASSPTSRDIREVREAHDAQAAVGLISNRLQNNWYSWRVVNAAIVTSYYLDEHFKSHTPDALRGYRVMASLHPLVMRNVGMLMTQDHRDREPMPNCIANRCMAARYTSIRQIDSFAPCMDCREAIQERKPEWPRGVEHRPPLVVGPQVPAMEQPAQSILLLGFGQDLDARHFDDAVRAITMATGLQVERAILPIDDRILRGRDGWLIPASLAKAAEAYLDEHQLDPAAICILVDDNLITPFPMLPQFMHLPTDHRMDIHADRPILFLGLFTEAYYHRPMTERLRAVEPIRPDDVATAPIYAKLFVGGLALAARKDHQCWTYGCPGTTWEAVASPFRCSYWVCQDCRVAMNRRYAQNSR